MVVKPYGCLGFLILAAGCQVDPTTPAAFRSMAARGDLAALRTAATRVKDLDACDSGGYSALSLAAFNGKVGAVEALVELGADLEVGTPQNRPLPLAIAQGNVEIVQLLLAKGARLEYGLDEPQPISYASDPDMIALLFKAGADLNRQGGWAKETALHRSAFTAKSESVRLLLSLGADPELKTEFGMTALHAVCRIRNAELLTEGKAGIRKILRLLLKAGANPNARDRNENTPLHYAARSTAFGPDEIALLIKAGARLDLVNVSGQTPLAIAQLHGFDRNLPRQAALLGTHALNKPK